MKTLQVVVGEPPGTLQQARLDNITLVPASLLPLKGTYQEVANRLPKCTLSERFARLTHRPIRGKPLWQ